MKNKKFGLEKFTALMVMFMLFPPVIGMSVEGDFSERENKTSEEWSEDIRLTYTNGITEPRDPVIAISGSIIHIVWSEIWGEVPNTRCEIRYMRSDDGGRTWSEIYNLTVDDGYWSHHPAVAVNGLNVHVVWQDDKNWRSETYYRNSTDGGKTWNAEKRLVFDDAWSKWPQIAIDRDNLYVVWSDDRGTDYEIYFKNSSDGGIIWSEDKNLTSNDGQPSLVNSIAISGSNIHVVWTDYRDGNWETYYKKSTNYGGTWSSDIPISKIDGWVSDGSAISTNGSNIHVVWEDYIGNNYYEIRYKNSTNNGETWNSEINITVNDGNDSTTPSISIEHSNIYVVWGDRRNYAPSLGSDVFYKHSLNNGMSWSEETCLTSGGGANTVVYNNRIHIVFCSDRTGCYEVYYKRYPKFNDPPEINDFYPTENLTITENQNITVTINASDPDNDTLTYLWYIDNYMLVGKNSSSYTFYANSTCSGTFEIKVIVSDNISSPLNHSWTLTVINVAELYNTISDLQGQINQLNLTISELSETINNLNQSLTLIWSELNQSVQNYFDLENQTLSLINTLSGIWELLNLSKQNEIMLQSYIGNLTENLTSANNLIAELWNKLNLSKQNETSLLNQIDELEQENTNLRNKLNETKTETSWVGIIETVIILVGLCVIVLVYRKKKKAG